jgi:hypothetical protein
MFSDHTEKFEKIKLYFGNKNDLRTFLTKLRTRCATMPDTQAKLRYAFNALSGPVASQVLPYVRDDRVELADLVALIKILKNAFDNPNRVRNAENKLFIIAQETRDFSTYFAEFQRYAAEVNWDDSAKMTALRRGISYQLRQDLVPVRDEPADMAEWVTLCLELEGRRKNAQPRAGPRA